MIDSSDQDFLQLKTKGNDEFKNKRYDDAISYYSKAISLKEDAIVYSNRSQCYINQNRFFDALRDCDTSLKLDPEYTKAYYRRAIVYKNLSRFELALEEFRKVTILDPTFTKCKTDMDYIKKLLVTDSRLDLKSIEKPDKFKSNLELKNFELNNQYFGSKQYTKIENK